MAEVVKYFDSQQDDETVIMVIRRHILELLPTFFICGFIYFLALAMIVTAPFFFQPLVSGVGYNFFVLIMSLILLFNTIALFSMWALHYLHVSILTNEHFVEIEQMGIFSRKISELSLDKIQDVSMSQKGVVNSVFNIGHLTVETAGEGDNFELHNIPDPYQTSQKIMEIEEDYCLRHGIRGDGMHHNACLTDAQQAGAEMPVNPVPSGGNEPEIEFPGERPPEA